MSVMEIRSFAPADEAAVTALWKLCGLTRPGTIRTGEVAGAGAAVAAAPALTSIKHTVTEFSKRN